MIILQAQQVGRSFDGITLFAGVNLEVQTNSRIGLVGPNGIGKTSLLKILAGEVAPDEGQVTTTKGMRLGYLAQDSGLDSSRTIFAEMLTVFEPLMALEQRMHDLEAQIASPDLDDDTMAQVMKQYDQVQHDFAEQNGYGYQAEIRTVLHGFQFDEATYEMPISNLSGGERSRLALAKLLLEKPDLLILDEPTNHLDITTLDWLEGYLRGYDGAILTVSHDNTSWIMWSTKSTKSHNTTLSTTKPTTRATSRRRPNAPLNCGKHTNANKQRSTSCKPLSIRILCAQVPPNRRRVAANS